MRPNKKDATRNKRGCSCHRVPPLSLIPLLAHRNHGFPRWEREEGCAPESVEQKPNHFRRLRPLGRRDADVGWRTPFRLSSFLRRALPLFLVSLFVACSNLPLRLDLYQTRNRPQIYCLESARMEAPSPWLMTYRGSREFSLLVGPGCSVFRQQHTASFFFVVSQIIGREAMERGIYSSRMFFEKFSQGLHKWSWENVFYEAFWTIDGCDC